MDAISWQLLIEGGLKIPVSLVRFRVRAPLFKEPAQKAGFCFSTSGLFIELRSITRCLAALRLRGPTLFEPVEDPQAG